MHVAEHLPPYKVKKICDYCCSVGIPSFVLNTEGSLRADSRARGLGFWWGERKERSFPSPHPLPKQNPKPRARELARRLHSGVSYMLLCDTLVVCANFLTGFKPK